MLIPKLRLVACKTSTGKTRCAALYFVWDSDRKKFIRSKYFGMYKTQEDCQNDINFYNSLSIAQVS